MTIVRILGAGKGFATELSSAEINSIDANVEKALDKRSGQADTLASVVTHSGAGRLIDPSVVGTDANTTYLVSAANRKIKVTNAVTNNRVYTLSNTNAANGDVIEIFCDASYTAGEITIQNAAATTLYMLGNQSTSDGNYASFVHNGTAWSLLCGLVPRLQHFVFTSSGTFTVPRGVTAVTVNGYGGAGGGGGGATPSSATDDFPASGGGGGGGALLGTRVVTVTPGASITVTVGAGGAGGASDTNGNDGADSTFGELARFHGGQGGARGLAITISVGSTYALLARGGAPVSAMPPASATLRRHHFPDATAATFWLAHGCHASGGFGLHSQVSGMEEYAAGCPNPMAGPYSLGGAAGTVGSTSIPASDVFYGGGRGGGGGGGPYQAAGAVGNAPSGGNGGNAGASGAAGTAGGAGIANSGAGGGGGGGGGGSVSGAAGAGGAGGNGGSGLVIVSWVK
jgi:hypothetical protein